MVAVVSACVVIGAMLVFMAFWTRWLKDTQLGPVCARLPASRALCPGQMEAIGRGADDIAIPGAEESGEFFGQRGLASGGRPVKGDADRVVGYDGLDGLGELT